MAAERYQMLVVANPQSAGGALGKRWPKLEAIIRREYGEFAHRFTGRSGDASQIAREAVADGVELVVAMGGDGTISEVVDGLMAAPERERQRAVLGILPYGTGGDFRKTVGAPKELAQGVRSLVGRATRRVDVGRLTYTTPAGDEAVRHFINIASFGIGGLVDELVNTHSKLLGGRVSFAVATWRAMRRYTPQRVRLEVDDHPALELPIHNVAVANGRFFGGGMHIAPHAALDDGLFDVIILGPMTMGDLVLRGHRVYGGTHLDLPQVQALRGRRVVARPLEEGERVLLDVDGETPGQLPARFELLAGALRLKIPEDPA